MEAVTTKEVALYDENDIGIEMSDVMMMFMMVMMISLMTVVVPSLSQQAQAQAYRGETDVRTIKASSRLQWLDVRHSYPFTPWISAYFINDGPHEVWVAINYPDARFLIKPNETITVDRSGAQERISVIFYICDGAKTASVRITGEY